MHSSYIMARPNPCNAAHTAIAIAINSGIAINTRPIDVSIPYLKCKLV